MFLANQELYCELFGSTTNLVASLRSSTSVVNNVFCYLSSALNATSSNDFNASTLLFSSFLSSLSNV